MRKLSAIFCSSALVLGLVACGGATAESSTAATDVAEVSSSASVAQTAIPSSESTGEASNGDTVTITTLNGAEEEIEVEFPANPQRLAVMDMASLDIIDNLGFGENVVGVSKGSSIDYLQSYMTDDSIANLGTVKEADLEALMAAEPDVIFIGGRLAPVYDELVKIAPVYFLDTDISTGVVASTKQNALDIASLYGAESQVDALVADYDARITALQGVSQDQPVIVGMVNAGGFSLLGNDGRCSIIGNEIGFNNIGVDANIDTSAHGNEASFEFVLEKNPSYIFVMDRDAAIGTEGAQLAAEVMNNDLVNKTTAAQNGNVIVLEHSNVWYTAEGGITALDIMLSDLEGPLLASN